MHPMVEMQKSARPPASPEVIEDAMGILGETWALFVSRKERKVLARIAEAVIATPTSRPPEVREQSAAFVHGVFAVADQIAPEVKRGKKPRLTS